MTWLLGWGEHDGPRWALPCRFLHILLIAILLIASASGSCFHLRLLRRCEGCRTHHYQFRLCQDWAPSWIWKTLNSNMPLLYTLLSPFFHDWSYSKELEGYDQDAEFSHKSLGLQYYVCDSSLSVECDVSGLQKFFCLLVDGHTSVNNIDLTLFNGVTITVIKYQYWVDVSMRPRFFAILRKITQLLFTWPIQKMWWYSCLFWRSTEEARSLLV